MFPSPANPRSVIRNPQSAFTLLETLVALSIFAIAVIGCVQALAEIGDTVGGLRQEGEARRHLQNHVAELRAQRPFPSLIAPAPKATNGLLIKDEVVQIEDPEAGIKPEDGLYQVRSVVSWKDSLGAQSLTNTFYLRGAK